METSIDHNKGQMSFTKTNPLFGMSPSKTDVQSFQSDDLKPVRQRRPWCFYFIIVYMILLTGLVAFFIYKDVRTLFNEEMDEDFQSLLQNNSQDMMNLKSRMSVLQSQVDELCGDGGLLHHLSSDMYKLNTSTQRLEEQLSNISLTPGPPGAKGQPGENGTKGMPGDRGLAGEKGAKGDVGQRGLSGAAGPPGPKGGQGPSGAKGDTGSIGPKGMTGVPGVTGQKGAKGDHGWQGFPGAAGWPGPRGYQGPQGPAGQKGQKGSSWWS